MKKNETKHEIIENHFIDLIKNKKINIGDQLPSENEIASYFNVSRHTVRQALSKLSEHGLIVKEKGKGTFCIDNFEKEEKASKNIALLTTYISNYIFPKITEGVEEVLRQKGYNLLLFNSNNDIENEINCLKSIENQDISGVIIEPAQSSINNLDKKYFQEFDKKNIKYIMINAYYEELNPAYLVLNDEQGGYRLTKYLIELGHKNIAAILKKDDIQGQKRKKGYIKALEENEVKIDETIIGEYTTDTKEMSIKEFLRSILKMQSRPSAIFCYNDEVALKCIEILRKDGIKVPEDISIVGFDDSSLATASEVKLTSIIHPKKQMGIQAAKYIIGMVEGKLKKPRYVYDAELIVRDSCTKK
ncbi:substrate-binding domain-containing protein [Clostridium neuense]|uniref:Substrate-binding domain-containing protein n=1 Tax=Clostridium neuense TaxID=1728934 RepID=A0ABW8TL93_9CLOT